MAIDGYLRIGELSKRSGVSPELLRAWERRYGVLQPERSPGGLRLYTDADLERVRAMQRHMAEGMAAAQAASLAAPSAARAPALSMEQGRQELAATLDDFDEPRAQAILDRIIAATTIDTLLGEVVLPYLHDLGERWERGEASVAQEHFASGVLRGRLLGLGRGWGLGIGPTAVVACLPGEQHDLGPIAFGLALRARGWRIAYLGADTPIATVAEASRRIDPALVVLSAATPDRVDAALPRLIELGRRHRVALGGAGAHDADGITVLSGPAVDEADRVAASL